MKITKVLVSLGAAVAAAKIVKALTNVGVDDALDFVGLERHRSHAWEKVAMFGAGALVGAGAGLMLAPASGRETRDKIGQGMDKLATKATDAFADIKQQLAPAEHVVAKQSGPLLSDLQRGNGNKSL